MKGWLQFASDGEVAELRSVEFGKFLPMQQPEFFWFSELNQRALSIVESSGCLD